jgi:hypothetical protein
VHTDTSYLDSSAFALRLRVQANALVPGLAWHVILLPYETGSDNNRTQRKVIASCALHFSFLIWRLLPARFSHCWMDRVDLLLKEGTRSKKNYSKLHSNYAQ